MITRLTNDARAVRAEIFGPAETVVGFDTEYEVLRVANDSPYGLAGMLFTTRPRPRTGSSPGGRRARYG